jgi:hypothetical protein
MKQATAKDFAVVGIVATIVATPLAALMMWLAWEGLFHELSNQGDLIIHWGTWLAIGASWFLPLFIAMMALGTFLRVLMFAIDRTGG